MREVKAVKINAADFAPYGTFCNMTEPEGYRDSSFLRTFVISFLPYSVLTVLQLL